LKSSKKKPEFHVNDPTWRPPWTTRDGKKKKGFWRVRVIEDGKARYVSLTPYGATRSKKDKVAAYDARKKYLDSRRSEVSQEALRRRTKQVTMREVLKKYVDDVVQHRKEDYRRQSQYYIDLFCDGHKGGDTILQYPGYGDLPAIGMTPEIIEQWHRYHSGWKTASITYSIAVVKAAINHAVNRGLMSKNPIRRMGAKRSIANPHPFSKGEEKAFAEAAKKINPEFAKLWQFLMDHGCRPKEACTMQSHHVHRTAQSNLSIKLAPHEWKCGTKSDRPRERVIVIAPQWIDWILEREASCNHLFLDRGNPWTKRRREYFQNKVRSSIGFDQKVLYDARHTWITRAIVAEIPIAKIAVMAGTSTKEIETTYSSYLKEIDDMSRIMAKLHA